MFMLHHINLCNLSYRGSWVCHVKTGVKLPFWYLLLKLDLVIRRASLLFWRNGLSQICLEFEQCPHRLKIENDRPISNRCVNSRNRSVKTSLYGLFRKTGDAQHAAPDRIWTGAPCSSTLYFSVYRPITSFEAKFGVFILYQGLLGGLNFKKNMRTNEKMIENGYDLDLFDKLSLVPKKYAVSS